MAEVLVQRTFRHASGAVARFVEVEITYRDAEDVLMSLTTNDLGLISVYLEPAQYDWLVFDHRIPFDVTSADGIIVPPSTYSFHQETPAAQWNLEHPAGVRRHPVILLDDEPTRQVYSDVDHVSPTLTLVIFPEPVTGWAYL